ncbi:FecCD family ABC transporter permease [Amycolatopsis nigrescens]|uniref:FecCD family ABC transporter permease n=1 Tax=Amycolatopsis nigrescens TaxID=381445 RepID=UPI00036A5069|nr:iron chelate uptake ABC transporter family permease subunit [Amycolatopsis nigrescens]
MSLREHRIVDRNALVIGAFILLTLALAVLSVGTGDFPLTIGEVLKTLAGQGNKAQYLVVTGRLPRVLVAILVGAALGLAGAVFQTLTRNPLGSPDIIGFSTGSATGGVAVIVLIGGGPGPVAIGALTGGLLTAALVAALCAPHGLLSGRLLLIGIAVSSVLVGLNSYLLTRTTVEAASQASTWLVGNLAGRDWSYLLPIGVAMVLLVPAVLVCAKPLRMMEMGDDAAIGVGVDVPRLRPVLFVLAVALTAMATATAGPVPFIALTAPQIAKRLTRKPGPNLVASAFLGSCLVVAADYLGQRLVNASLLPVGVVAAALGGAYLLWMLIFQRKTR